MQTGLEAFLIQGSPELAGRRAGLITNHTGIDSRFRSTIDLLHATDRLELAALFGPEHGVRGEAQAGVEVGGATDRRTGLPVHSLYGPTLRPTRAMLEGLDVLIFDLQDIGVRYATYVSTMVYAQEAAAAAGLTFAVFDRPNPLSGIYREGNVLDPGFASFVGVYPLPVRHGLTVGEVARLVAAERDWPEPLIVPMRGWRRDRWLDGTGLPWVQPSPNLPTLDSVTLYPGTCLIEGTNVSEGRGTTRPFEIVGAPWLDPFRLAAQLGRRDLPGVAFRPAYFTPTGSKHANVSCGGVQVHVIDRASLKPVELGVQLLHSVRALSPDEFAWRDAGGERPFVDRLYGGDTLRRSLEAGAEAVDITAGWTEDLAAFEERIQPCLLYSVDE